jgi:hypothetical protein
LIPVNPSPNLITVLRILAHASYLCAKHKYGITFDQHSISTDYSAQKLVKQITL